MAEERERSMNSLLMGIFLFFFGGGCTLGVLVWVDVAPIWFETVELGVVCFDGGGGGLGVLFCCRVLVLAGVAVVWLLSAPSVAAGLRNHLPEGMGEWGTPGSVLTKTSC